MHRKYIQFFFSLVPVCLFWLILNESWSLRDVAAAVLVALFSVAFTNRIILDGKGYAAKFSMNIFTVLKYAGYLLCQIYAAGFSAMIRVITGHTRVQIVDIDTSLESDFRVALLANSITLTPGTVTLDRDGKKLLVIWLSDSETDLPTRNRIIKGNFEKILGEGSAG